MDVRHTAFTFHSNHRSHYNTSLNNLKSNRNASMKSARISMDAHKSRIEPPHLGLQVVFGLATSPVGGASIHPNEEYNDMCDATEQNRRKVECLVCMMACEDLWRREVKEGQQIGKRWDLTSAKRPAECSLRVVGTWGYSRR